MFCFCVLLFFLLVFFNFFDFSKNFSTILPCQVSQCGQESSNFKRFLQVSRFVKFFSRYCLLLTTFHLISKVRSFDVLNYSHKWKYPKNIVESENNELSRYPIRKSFSYFSHYNSLKKHNSELAETRIGIHATASNVLL